MIYIVNAVIVTMFQPPQGGLGELSLFRERLALKKVTLPETGMEEVYWSEERSVFAIVAGVGTANTAVSILSLLRAKGYDFSNAQWLIFGIAGGNPNFCSLGSVVICDHCIDADLAFEIDGREIPENWDTGIFPLGASEPYGKSAMDPQLFGRPYQSFTLSPSEVAKAVESSRGLSLVFSDELAAINRKYEAYQGAQDDTRVIIGACLSGARFWHGVYMNRWAEKWVRHYTNGEGRFLASAMEDTGTLLALQQAARWGEVDFSKVVLVRAISNYTMPPPGVDPVSHLVGDEENGHYPGMKAALENGFLVCQSILDSSS